MYTQMAIEYCMGRNDDRPLSGHLGLSERLVKPPHSADSCGVWAFFRLRKDDDGGHLMHVLVTGGAGFVGSHVAMELLSAGHQVTVVDDLSTGETAQVSPAARLVTFDLTQPGLHALVGLVRPDAVVHCAAQVSVSQANVDPLNDLQRNVAATVNLVTACRGTTVHSIVYASSAAVYGQPRYLPVDEEHPQAPLSPYGYSKMVGEWYIRTLGEQIGLRTVILRYANVYGPRQRLETDGAVVPLFVEAMLTGRDPVIHGTGEQRRDFVHVTDVSRANRLALEQDVSGTHNISSGRGTSIMELWRLAAAATGWSRPPVFAGRRQGDIAESVLKPSRAVCDLGWAPAVDLATGLEWTVAHWRKVVGVA